MIEGSPEVRGATSGQRPPSGGLTIDEYTEAELHRLLAERAEIAEQGIMVMRRDQTLILGGEVESGRRRDEILRVVAEVLPGVKIRSDIAVTRAQPPSEAEELL